jgi:hypothetical protein
MDVSDLSANFLLVRNESITAKIGQTHAQKISADAPLARSNLLKDPAFRPENPSTT